MIDDCVCVYNCVPFSQSPTPTLFGGGTEPVLLTDRFVSRNHTKSLIFIVDRMQNRYTPP